MSVSSFLINSVFPRTCVGCDRSMPHDARSFVCKDCRLDIELVKDPSCPFCRSPSRGGTTCPFCKKNSSLDSLTVIASYDDRLVKRMIKELKYRFLRDLAADIGIMMAERINKIGLVKSRTIIVPVPLHKLRYNWRGFNQSEDIARVLANSSAMDFMPNALTRIKHSKPQAEIADKQERISSARGLFRVSRDCATLVNNKRIVLVDDVATTGATLDDCARTLKNAGAINVAGLVFARG